MAPRPVGCATGVTPKVPTTHYAKQLANRAVTMPEYSNSLRYRKRGDVAFPITRSSSGRSVVQTRSARSIALTLASRWDNATDLTWTSRFEYKSRRFGKSQSQSPAVRRRTLLDLPMAVDRRSRGEGSHGANGGSQATLPRHHDLVRASDPGCSATSYRLRKGCRYPRCAAKFRYVTSSIGNHSVFQSINGFRTISSDVHSG